MVIISTWYTEMLNDHKCSTWILMGILRAYNFANATHETLLRVCTMEQILQIPLKGHIEFV